jgi:hypothetical protein
MHEDIVCILVDPQQVNIEDVFKLHNLPPETPIVRYRLPYWGQVPPLQVLTKEGLEEISAEKVVPMDLAVARGLEDA